jgi:regulatory protein
MSFGVDQKLQRALDLGYAYVNRRERTVVEVRAQLERTGTSPGLIDAAVRTLAEQGFLNDERFTEMFVSDKRELEHWGNERIRRGLLARGIDRELAESVLAGTRRGAAGDGEEEPSELDRAVELLRRRFPAPPQDRRNRERALGMLLRKGYESDLALDALHQHVRGD